MDVDQLIAKRHKKRIREEGERPAEEMYAESCRRYHDRECTERLWTEVRYREGMIRAHTATLSALVDGHRQALERALAMLGIASPEDRGEGVR